MHTTAAVDNHLSDDQIMEPNVAYGALDKSKRRINRVRNGVNITQGTTYLQLR